MVVQQSLQQKNSPKEAFRFRQLFETHFPRTNYLRNFGQFNPSVRPVCILSELSTKTSAR